MTALPPRLETFVGAQARQLISRMEDTAQRTRLIATLEVCAGTLAAVDAIDIERYELFDLDLPDLSVWNEAAPQVACALRALHDAVKELTAMYPAPQDETEESELELELSLDDEDVPIRAGPSIDLWMASEEPPDHALSSLVAMLERDVAVFGQKLRTPAIVSSRFALLAELQEFTRGAVQCLEAVAAAVLKPLSPDHLTVLLPRYSTELARSLLLREDLASLSRDIGAMNERLRAARAEAADEAADAASEQASVAADVSARLDAFAALPVSRQVWARDKRALIEARLFLRTWRGDAAALGEAVEGLARFLELLVEGVSRRPEVEDYDRENAELADLLSP